METAKHPHIQEINTEKWLRLKLVTAFNGDVIKADIALSFVNGNTEASEEYRRFKEWQLHEHLQYCESKGIEVGYPTSKAKQSQQ